MTRKHARRYKLTRKLAVFLAAGSVFQLGQCNTFGNRVGANFTNGLPSAVFQVLFGFALLPVQLILGGGQLTGTGSNSGSNGGGI